MKMKYKIIKDKNLLIDILEGYIELSDLEKIFQYEINDVNFKYVDRVFSDISKAQFKISVDELQRFINYMITPNPNTNFRWAILTSTPIETAFSFLIKKDSYFNHIANVFSTVNACSQFLGVEIDENYLDQTNYIVLK